MCDIPVPIDDGEKIVRAVFSQHVSGKTNLRKNLFDDATDKASVMRHTYLGSDECKRRALAIKPGNPDLKYKGLAVIHAHGIRAAGAEVYDSREIECGHAHVSTNIAVPPEGDPLQVKIKYERDERLRALKDNARFLADPNSTDPAWTGEAV